MPVINLEESPPKNSQPINISLNKSKENLNFSMFSEKQEFDPFLAHLKEIEDLYWLVKEGRGQQANREFDLKMKVQ